MKALTYHNQNLVGERPSNQPSSTQQVNTFFYQRLKSHRCYMTNFSERCLQSSWIDDALWSLRMSGKAQPPHVPTLMALSGAWPQFVLPRTSGKPVEKRMIRDAIGIAAERWARCRRTDLHSLEQPNRDWFERWSNPDTNGDTDFGKLLLHFSW